MIYYMYMYYSRGWMDYVLLLLKLITQTHMFMPQTVLNLSASLNIMKYTLYGNMVVLLVQQYS